MKHSATHRILRRSLAELLISISASRLELYETTDAESTDTESVQPEALIKIGTGNTQKMSHTTDVPYAGYMLRVESADLLAPDALTEIRIHHRLAGILLRGVYTDANLNSSTDAPAGQGRIRSGFLTETLLELLHLMDERGRRIANYVKIIELNDKILAANELYDVLQLVMDLAKTAVGGDDAALLLVDPRTGEMTFKVVAESFESNSRKLEQIRIPSGQGIAGSVMLSAQAEIIRDVSTDARSFQKVDRILGQTTRDMVVAPIVARGRVIGVIEVINSRARNGFLSEDLEMLQQIASHASLFIENIRTKEQLARVSLDLDRKNGETGVLAELTGLLGATGPAANDDSMQNRFLRTLVTGLRLPAAALLQVSADQKSLQEIAHFSSGTHSPSTTGSTNLASHAPDEFTPGSTRDTWTGVSDLLLWLMQNQEPFRFTNVDSTPGNPIASEFAGSAPGLENRFRAANPIMLADPARAPGVWLPVFARGDRHIDLVISLSGLSVAPSEAAGELLFFRTVMNLTRAIFTLDA